MSDIERRLWCIDLNDVRVSDQRGNPLEVVGVVGSLDAEVRVGVRLPDAYEGAVAAERMEAVIHDWTCGCGNGQACPNRDGCREAAEQIATERGQSAASPSSQPTTSPEDES